MRVGTGLLRVVQTLIVWILLLGGCVGEAWATPPAAMATDPGAAAALLRDAEADLARGALQQGLAKANEAAEVARAEDNALGLAAALVVRANLALASGDLARAASDLEAVLEDVSAIGDDALELTAMSTLANVRLAEGRVDAAIELYAVVARRAAAAGATTLAIRAEVNQLRAEVEAGRTVSAARRAALRDRVAEEGDLARRARFRTHVAASAIRALEGGAADRAALLTEAHEDLRSALALADRVADPVVSARIRAEALGRMGGLYVFEQRLDEALALTRRALLQAARSEAEASLFPWHLQAARLFARQDRRGEAIDAYAAALDVLEAHRGAIERRQRLAPATAGASETARLYREYVDLLLRRARAATDEAARRADLETAQAVLERLKSDELRDYFEDDCVVRYREKLAKVTDAAVGAVVIYPVLLEDRLELLVSAGPDLHQIAVPVRRDRLRAEVLRFRRLLEKRTTREYLRPARRLESWLIDPVEPILERVDPSTLVFIPDGILRTVPMAALHDGERFLVERYALGLTPGLELTDPRPFSERERRAVVAGISEAVQGFSALPHVEAEVASIQSLTGATGLLNEAFSGERLTRRIRSEDFGLIHIASHAEFDEEASGGFMLTHDGRIGFDEFAEAVASSQFRDEPLDLVVLSACETAEGDERAALGLSGIAIKSGARSALGTLWSVSDSATTVFMTRFYAALAEPEASRATAVREAQLRLLRDRAYRHPFYWSPFLLINSWL